MSRNTRSCPTYLHLLLVDQDLLSIRPVLPTCISVPLPRGSNHHPPRVPQICSVHQLASPERSDPFIYLFISGTLIFLNRSWVAPATVLFLPPVHRNLERHNPHLQRRTCSSNSLLNTLLSSKKCSRPNFPLNALIAVTPLRVCPNAISTSLLGLHPRIGLLGVRLSQRLTWNACMFIIHR